MTQTCIVVNNNKNTRVLLVPEENDSPFVSNGSYTLSGIDVAYDIRFDNDTNGLVIDIQSLLPFKTSFYLKSENSVIFEIIVSYVVTVRKEDNPLNNCLRYLINNTTIQIWDFSDIKFRLYGDDSYSKFIDEKRITITDFKIDQSSIDDLYFIVPYGTYYFRLIADDEVLANGFTSFEHDGSKNKPTIKSITISNEKNTVNGTTATFTVEVDQPFIDDAAELYVIYTNNTGTPSTKKFVDTINISKNYFFVEIVDLKKNFDQQVSFYIKYSNNDNENAKSNVSISNVFPTKRRFFVIAKYENGNDTVSLPWSTTNKVSQDGKVVLDVFTSIPNGLDAYNPTLNFEYKFYDGSDDGRPSKYFQIASNEYIETLKNNGITYGVAKKEFDINKKTTGSRYVGSLEFDRNKSGWTNPVLELKFVGINDQERSSYDVCEYVSSNVDGSFTLIPNETWKFSLGRIEPYVVNYKHESAFTSAIDDQHMYNYETYAEAYKLNRGPSYPQDPLLVRGFYDAANNNPARRDVSSSLYDGTRNVYVYVTNTFEETFTVTSDTRSVRIDFLEQKLVDETYVVVTTTAGSSITFDYDSFIPAGKTNSVLYLYNVQPGSVRVTIPTDKITKPTGALSVCDVEVLDYFDRVEVLRGYLTKHQTSFSSVPLVFKTPNTDYNDAGNVDDIIGVLNQDVSKLDVSGLVDTRKDSFNVRNEYDENGKKIPWYSPNRSKVKRLVLPDYMTAIPAGSTLVTPFQGFDSLESLEGKNVTFVGKYAFYGSKIKTITLPGLKTAEDYAFARSESMVTTSGLEWAGNSCFWGKDWSSSTSSFPELRHVGAFCFENCTFQNGVVIRLDKAEFVGRGTFKGSNVKKVFFGRPLQVGERTFSKCGDLTDVYLLGPVPNQSNHPFGVPDPVPPYVPPNVFEAFGRDLVNVHASGNLWKFRVTYPWNVIVSFSLDTSGESSNAANDRFWDKTREESDRDLVIKFDDVTIS